MIQQNIPSSVKNSPSSSSTIWAVNMPNLAKNYLWQATFTTSNLNQSQLYNLKLRYKKIKHDTPNRKFSLTFDEFEDFEFDPEEETFEEYIKFILTRIKEKNYG